MAACPRVLPSQLGTLAAIAETARKLIATGDMSGLRKLHARLPPELQKIAGGSGASNRTRNNAALVTFFQGFIGCFGRGRVAPTASASSYDPNKLDADGNTPLISAIEKQDRNTFDTLLSVSGIDVNKPNNRHITPLLAAIGGPTSTMYFVEKLLTIRAVHLNEHPDPEVRMPLVMAMGVYNYAAATMLVQKGAIPYPTKTYIFREGLARQPETFITRAIADIHSTPAAASHGEKLEFLKVVLKRTHGEGIDTANASGLSPLAYAIIIGDVPIVKLILKYRFNRSLSSLSGNNTILKEAVKWPEVMRILLKKAEENHELVRLLRHTNEEGKTILGMILTSRIPNSVDVKKEMMKLFAPHEDGIRSLKEVVKYGDADTFDAYIRHVANPNVRDTEVRADRDEEGEGDDIFLYAIRTKKLKLVEYMVNNYDCNINVENTKTGHSALQLALRSHLPTDDESDYTRAKPLRVSLNYKRLVGTMLAKTDIEHKDKDGRTILMDAMEWRELYILEKLLKQGADVSWSNNDFRKQFYQACDEGHFDVLKQIVDLPRFICVNDEGFEASRLNAVELMAKESSSSSSDIGKVNYRRVVYQLDRALKLSDIRQRELDERNVIMARVLQQRGVHEAGILKKIINDAHPSNFPKTKASMTNNFFKTAFHRPHSSKSKSKSRSGT